VYLQVVVDDTIAHATGRAHRDNEVRPGTGGPGGNLRLTAWTGIVLLVLLAAELVTLLDVHGLVQWHVALGVLLIPPALLKTASTTWRIVRYYGGDAAYRRAGPPPLLLRVAGPLVVATTLGVLASGVVLVLVGPHASTQDGVALLGGRTLSLVSVHKGFFVLWAGVTGLHVVGRLVPAWQSTLGRLGRSRRVPGRHLRVAALTVTALAAIGVTALTLSLVDTSGWSGLNHDHGSKSNIYIKR
jgi:hypothetical protein